VTDHNFCKIQNTKLPCRAPRAHSARAALRVPPCDIRCFGHLTLLTEPIWRSSVLSHWPKRL